MGIFGFCWLAIQLKPSSLPKGISWDRLYGTETLCGIGFTMSLFIGSLAFEKTTVNMFFDEKLGVIIGSVASGFAGYLILNACLGKGVSEEKI